MDPRAHEMLGNGLSPIARLDWFLITTVMEELANTLVLYSITLGLTRAYAPS
jgi:hypothetical protein